MDEQDWLTSTDPARMLRHLTGRPEPHESYGRRRHPAASDRKLRLFAVACARQAWDRLTDRRSRRAVEAAERYADGEATQAPGYWTDTACGNGP